MGAAVVGAVREVDVGRFEADVDPEWTIVGKPNGGYLLAMLGRAAATASAQSDVAAASAHYLRSPDPGPVEIDTEVLRVGRTASQVRVRMAQAGRPCVEALVTTSTFDPDGAPYWDTGAPDPGTVGPGAGERLAPVSPDGRRVAIMDQVELRLDPECSGFRVGEPSGRGELRGWLALPDGMAFDSAGLLYAGDALPPATFEVESAGWVPTLELTVYVRALPAPGPVRVLQRAQLIDGQRVDEACTVWDVTGRLVAQATQLAAIRLG
jgi:acyl-coenzyme A thioesterase PaaI-like protein